MSRVVHRPTARPASRRDSSQSATIAHWLLRGGVAAMLATDTYVHAKDARNYDFNGPTISQGSLFRIEAGAATMAAAVVLLWHRRTGWLPALTVAASALAAVLIYRYINIGALGPLPNMYEPTWDVPGKQLSAYAEATTTGLALLGLISTNTPRGPKTAQLRLRNRQRHGSGGSGRPPNEQCLDSRESPSFRTPHQLRACERIFHPRAPGGQRISVDLPERSRRRGVSRWIAIAADARTSGFVGCISPSPVRLISGIPLGGGRWSITDTTEETRWCRLPCMRCELTRASRSLDWPAWSCCCSPAPRQ
jgi:hypothetical protein